MKDSVVTTVIDPEKCIGCGECVRVCPDETLSMRDGKAEVTGDRSMHCGHCAAVCPTDAVTVGGLEPAARSFATFPMDDRWLAFGRYDLPDLVRLMGSRRSCRNYREMAVSRDLLEDLVKIGITAPSGTNSQKWTFTILPHRQAVLALGRQIARFFEKLNRMAEKPWLRKGLRWIGKPQLDDYFRDYYDSVRQGLRDWRESGRDRLFHGATAAIIVGAMPGASCPAEDALLATQNILLAAHAMGLGTCLVGFAKDALVHDPKMKSTLDIPAEEAVYAVIALGYPDETYRHPAGRKMPVIRYAVFDNR
jgi:nitroreductase/NAD-dependent dihydropyrimidine dehydrogenase PreA subunit